MSAMNTTDVRTALSEVAESDVMRRAELIASGQEFVSFVELELASLLEIRSNGRTRSAKVLTSSTMGDRDSGACASVLLLRSSVIGAVGGVSACVSPAADSDSMDVSLPSAVFSIPKTSLLAEPDAFSCLSLAVGVGSENSVDMRLASSSC